MYQIPPSEVGRRFTGWEIANIIAVQRLERKEDAREVRKIELQEEAKDQRRKAANG